MVEVALIQKLETIFYSLTLIFLIIFTSIGSFSYDISKNNSVCQIGENGGLLVNENFKTLNSIVSWKYDIEPIYEEYTSKWANISILVILIVLGILFMPRYLSNMKARIVEYVSRKLFVIVMMVYIYSFLNNFALVILNNEHTLQYRSIDNISINDKSFSVQQSFGGRLNTLYVDNMSYSESVELCNLNKDFYENDSNGYSVGACAYSVDNLLQVSYFPRPDESCHVSFWNNYYTMNLTALIMQLLAFFSSFFAIYLHLVEYINFIDPLIDRYNNAIAELENRGRDRIV